VIDEQGCSCDGPMIKRSVQRNSSLNETFLKKLMFQSNSD